MKTSGVRSFLQPKPIHQIPGQAVRPPGSKFLRAARRVKPNLYVEYAQNFFTVCSQAIFTQYKTNHTKLFGEPQPGGRQVLWIPTSDLFVTKEGDENTRIPLNGMRVDNGTPVREFLQGFLRDIEETMTQIDTALLEHFSGRREPGDLVCDRFLIGGIATQSLADPTLSGFYVMTEVLESQNMIPLPILRKVPRTMAAKMLSRTPEQLGKFYAQRRALAPTSIEEFRMSHQLPAVHSLVEPPGIDI